MNNFYHWIEQNGRICAFVHSANTYSPIATIHNKRAVNQMLAYSQLGEDVEHVVDKLVSSKYSPEIAITEVVKLVKKTIEVTS